MKTFKIQREQYIDLPIDKVFRFFESPDNLGKLTPADLHWEILTPKPLNIWEGRIFDYNIKPLGIPIHWRSIISYYEPPYRFVDEQLKGPYQFWHHVHTFETKGNGTLVKDEVYYRLPFGIFGKIIHKFFVHKKLEHIFDYRQLMLRSIFEKPETEELKNVAA